MYCRRFVPVQLLLLRVTLILQHFYYYCASAKQFLPKLAHPALEILNFFYQQHKHYLYRIKNCFGILSVGWEVSVRKFRQCSVCKAVSAGTFFVGKGPESNLIRLGIAVKCIIHIRNSFPFLLPNSLSV